MPQKNVASATDGQHDEKSLLARFIQLEGAGQPAEAMLAIGIVIMNRVHSPKFPNSVKEVISQPKQFASIAQVNKMKDFSKEAMEAAEQAVAGNQGNLNFPPNIFYFGKPGVYDKVDGNKKAIFRQIGEVYFYTEKLFAK